MVGNGSSCGACKFLRRKCEDICIFAPNFSYEGAELHFAAVHKVFGASNVSKLLSHLPLCNRSIAAITLSFEAEARIRDPIRGCVSQILALQHQVARLQEEVETFTTQMMFKGTLTSNEAKRHFLGQNDQGNANHFNADLQVLNPSYREAIEKLEDCLFSDEQCSWEELDMYISNLEKDLMI